MRKTIFIFLFAILFSPFASAEIIANQQLNSLYNLGDVINFPVKIVASSDIKNFFSINLLCDEKNTEIYKEYIVLSMGNEKRIDTNIPIIRGFINRPEGKCVVKLALGANYVLTNEFKISDLIAINLVSEKKEFAPQEDFIIDGEAKKENGESVEGFIKVNLINDDSNENIEVLDIVKGGHFYINFSLPKKIKAGQHLVRLNVFEKDGEESEANITNKGFSDYYVSLIQVPTDLEIVFKNLEIDPGANLEVKAVLHDQTGEKIASTAIITIKGENNKIFGQMEKPTDEFLEFPMVYNEPPGNGRVVAVSNKLTKEAVFKIKEKESVKTELVNNTIILTNAGNVIYNKSVIVKIGDKLVEVDAYLKVDESKKYVLSAPDGEYDVEIDSSEDKITGRVVLTGGNIIDVKEESVIMNIIKHPLAWFFMVIVLFLAILIIFKKGYFKTAYKKSFIDYINSKRKDNSFFTKERSNFKIKNKAELSLSIKGNKQDVSLVCLKLKNIEEILSKDGSSARDSIQKAVNLAEESKAFVYETNDTLFFILSPVKTKTFKNEETALKLAQIIESALKEHNKIFKQKVDFGISLDYGEIIAKPEKGALKFMGLGMLITNSKKISSISDKEILLDEKIKERLAHNLKTEMHKESGVEYYIIKEVKNHGNGKFLTEFVKRLERDEKKNK